MDAELAPSFVAELQREVSPAHLLFGLQVTAIARRIDCDDVLFQITSEPERFAVVHLTWTGRPQFNAEQPSTVLFDTISEFSEKRMKQDTHEYGST
jgi:hypothetical protein